VWVKVAPVDPDLPIRGRYVRLQVEVAGLAEELTPGQPFRRVRLSVEKDNLVVELDDRGRGGYLQLWRSDEADRAVLAPPLAFFIPEHVPDPSRRPPGEELWAEVTVPRSGPPRPIQLGVKKSGRLTPLELRSP
jgi:hypothetical protein